MPETGGKLGKTQAAMRLACQRLRDLEDALNGNGLVAMILEPKSLVPLIQRTRQLLARSHCYRGVFLVRVVLHNSKIINECLSVLRMGVVKRLLEIRVTVQAGIACRFIWFGL